MRSTYSLINMGSFMAPPFMESPWNLLDDTLFMAPSSMEPSSWHLLQGTPRWGWCPLRTEPPAEDRTPAKDSTLAKDSAPC